MKNFRLESLLPDRSIVNAGATSMARLHPKTASAGV
jgi:hypothetical protein|tara:strand:+ start:76197 stop:76304 length:108 start_codon:yes stop_codon:yes gene_type:complete